MLYFLINKNILIAAREINDIKISGIYRET